MKIIKVLLKIFAIGVIIVVFVIAGMALYMKFYGKSTLENTLSNMLGSKVKFESVSLNLDKYMVNFKGFTILDKIDFGKDIFNAEKFTLTIDKDSFDKDKSLVFNEIAVKRAVLNIQRNRAGIFNISKKPRKTSKGGAIAYADIPEPSGGFYNFVKNVKKVTIEDSVINFKDDYVPGGPFEIICKGFNLDLKSGGEPNPSTGSISVEYLLSFKVPNKRYYKDGEALLKGSMAVYNYKTDMDTTLETRYIDLMRFLPYFESYTPFFFNDGFFDSTTKFEVHDNMITSLTTMALHRLRLMINPSRKNAQFLETSVDRLIPYLMSGEDTIAFDFVIRGSVNNPQFGLGPKVKFAMGMVAVEELSKMLQQLQ